MSHAARNPAAKFEISIIEGPVTVASGKVSGKWHSVALEFDLLGIGDTKQESFEALKEVVNQYLFSVLDTEGPVDLFSHTPEEEAPKGSRKKYQVAAIFERRFYAN